MEFSSNSGALKDFSEFFFLRRHAVNPVSDVPMSPRWSDADLGAPPTEPGKDESEPRHRHLSPHPDLPAKAMTQAGKP
jgi:hypothetical protein